MDLPSVLGGLAQGFVDFGKSAVDLFGTGGAAFADLIQGTGTKNQDDFRKWLYQTDSVQDAAAKGLGTALNGAQTISDYVIPGGVSKSLLFNAGQGALGGLADEFKTYGENYDLGRAGQRALVSAGAAGAGTGLANALKKSGSGLLQSGLAQGASRGALSGAINQGGYAAIDGGDIAQSALQGAGMGALLGGATGAIQDFVPRKQQYMPLTEEEKTARIANAKQMLETATTPERRAELQAQISRLGGTVENGPAPGNKRLYRGLTQEYDPNYPANKLDTSGYESWTDNPELARQYGENVYYIDVPEKDIKTSYLDENPMSETYGDRNPIYSITKPAGLNGVSGTEYLLYMDDPYQKNLTYNRLSNAPTLDATLANVDMATNSVPDYLGDEKYNALVKKAKNYKSLDRFEKMNNPIKGSEIWGEKPTSIFQRDSRAVRVNMFPNEAAKGTGLTKQYLLNMFKDAYDQGITRIIPSYGIYTDEGASFMSHLADQGWLTETGGNGYKTYEIAPKIVEWEKTNPLADIYNAANGKTAKNLEATLSNADLAVNSPKLTPEQEAYFKDSVVRDDQGNLKTLYHGSPNEAFYTFNRDLANPESDWGRGFYFSDNEADVKSNYAGGGPDFDNKVARRAEQLEQELEIPYEQAEKQARNEMLKGSYQMDVYANMREPATVGKTMLFDGSEYGVRPLSDYDNIDDYYTDLIYDMTDDVINDTNIDYDAYKQPIMSILDEARWNGGIGLQELKDKLSELMIEDYDGNIVSSDVARSIIQNLGYDGIIDPTVSSKFNMDIDKGTTHYIAFEPNQVKDIKNLKPTSDPNILRALLPFIGLGGLGGGAVLEQILNSKDEDKKKTNKRSA